MTEAGEGSTIVISMGTNAKLEIQYRVEIKPSYEWSEKARELNISHRELEVLSLVVEGYKNKEVAQILKIQHQSVKNHLQHLFKKLNVRNSTQAYIIALNLNLIRMRARMMGAADAAVVEMKAVDVVEDLRRIARGEMEVEGLDSKKRREWLRVWLKEHGIEPYDW